MELQPFASNFNVSERKLYAPATQSIVFSILVALMLPLAQPATAFTYSVQDVGTLGGAYSYGFSYRRHKPSAFDRKPLQTVARLDE
jgi:hypothetical protein